MKNRRSASRSPESMLRFLRSGLVATCGVVVAVGLVYEAMWAIRFVTSHPYFTLTEIHVDGNRRLERDEILKLAELQPGTSSWDASPEDIRMNLLRNPWIREAEIRREFPNGLSIEVTERRPAAAVQLDGLYYVDQHGHLLGPVGTDDSRDFPLITGFATPDTKNYAAAGIRRALRLLRLCARGNAFGGVSEIAIDRDYGPTVFPLRPAVGVRLGWGNWRQKIGNSQRVLRAWEGRTEQLRSIDLSFRNRAVVKLKEVTEPPKNDARIKLEPRKKGTRI